MNKKDDAKDELERKMTILSKSFHVTRNSLLEEADSLYFHQVCYQASLKRCLPDLIRLSSKDGSQIATLQRQISAEIDFNEKQEEKFKKSCHAFFTRETSKEDGPSKKLLDKKIILVRNILGDEAMNYFPKTYKNVLAKGDKDTIAKDIQPLSTMLLMIGIASTITVLEEVVDAVKSDKRKSIEKISSIEKTMVELESMILEIQARRCIVVKKEHSIMMVHSSLQSLVISNILKDDVPLPSDGALLRHMEYASSLMKEPPQTGKAG